MNDLVIFLKSVELFNGLNNNELERVSENVERLKFDKDSPIFTEDSLRDAIYIIRKGEIELLKKDDRAVERRLVIFTEGNFLGEGVISDGTKHSTSAKAHTDSIIYKLHRNFFKIDGEITMKIYSNITRVVSRRMHNINSKAAQSAAQYMSGATRQEHDLLGTKAVPIEAYYGIQTLRAVENFNISDGCPSVAVKKH